MFICFEMKQSHQPECDNNTLNVDIFKWHNYVEGRPLRNTGFNYIIFSIGGII